MPNSAQFELRESPSSQLMELEFNYVYLFWRNILVNPDRALREDLPKSIAAIETMTKHLLAEDEPVDPFEAVRRFREISEDLANPKLPCMGAEMLPYDPVSYFGRDAIDEMVVLNWPDAWLNDD